MGMPVVLQVFVHKLKKGDQHNFDLMMLLDEKQHTQL